MDYPQATDLKKRIIDCSEPGLSNTEPKLKKSKVVPVTSQSFQSNESGDFGGLRFESKGGINSQKIQAGRRTLSTSMVDSLKSNRTKQTRFELPRPPNDQSRSVAPRIRKLVPPRPFPTVPTSVSATGPKSSQQEGKNYLCITRRTPLGAYLRRCKDVILKDGYKSLYLHALGAAIPHLSRLVVSLPPTLPFSPDEIHTEVTTGTVELHDEVIPYNDDDDITIRTRGKSTLSVVIRIGDGKDRSPEGRGATRRKKRDDRKNRVSTASALGAGQIVCVEADQDISDY